LWHEPKLHKRPSDVLGHHGRRVAATPSALPPRLWGQHLGSTWGKDISGVTWKRTVLWLMQGWKHLTPEMVAGRSAAASCRGRDPERSSERGSSQAAARQWPWEEQEGGMGDDVQQHTCPHKHEYRHTHLYTS